MKSRRIRAMELFISNFVNDNQVHYKPRQVYVVNGLRFVETRRGGFIITETQTGDVVGYELSYAAAYTFCDRYPLSWIEHNERLENNLKAKHGGPPKRNNPA